MAYTKYIKKGGKIYGPYIYHSRRINGKVISEYHGQKKFNYKTFLSVILGILFVTILIYIIFLPDKGITGQAVLDLNANYQEGEPIAGKITVSLREGELIPASSKLVFENNKNLFEYNLRDLLNEKTTEGDFYVSGTSVSGTGEGYGIAGEKETFPEVYFTLSILSEEKIEEPVSGGSEEQPGTGSEVVLNETNETSPEITTEQTTTENETEQTTTETTEEATTTAETITPEETTEQSAEQTEQEETTEEAPVTGNIISRFAGGISNFFLGLGPTGNVVIEFEKEVEGKVSAGEIFTYTLQEGQRAEIKPRSVRTDSKQLPDKNVELITEGNEVTVTTKYSVREKGFGRDYLGDKTKRINIDISDLGLVFEQGDLKVSIISDRQEIISLTTTLGEGETIAAGTTPEETETFIQEPELPKINRTNQTEIPLPEAEEVLELTEQERAVLAQEFGNVSVEVKEANLRGEFIIIRYELGDLWVEHSYSSDLDNETLGRFMEADRIKWLKDIAKSLSEEEEPEQEIEEFVGNYSV